ncbi:hypothetical protein T07_4273 [Trichinella nelsoni]|uniref:Uncharacterized protein n=1 Tax=Trichinella nelsoni TaxID=6336 RepID=A0A0V0RHX7_9BILA|nr:hypothetical protein T07_4273 [Trichinella nelsoni]
MSTMKKRKHTNAVRLCVVGRFDAHAFSVVQYGHALYRCTEEEKWKFDDSLIDGGWFTMMALRKRFKNQSGFHKRPLENLPATDTHYRHSGVEEFVAVVVMSMRHAYHHKQVRNREPGYLWVTVCLFHCIVSGPVWSGPVRVMQMLSGR